MDLKLSGQLPAGQGDSTFFGALAAALAAGACAGWVARGGSCCDVMWGLKRLSLSVRTAYA